MDEKNYPTRDDVRKSQFMAGRVKRYHTWPVHHQETVDEHSMGVLRIYRQIFGLMGVSVVKYIMDHDLPEIVTGDAPYPVKRDNPDLSAALEPIELKARVDLGLPTDYSVTPQEKTRIKICDLLQMWQFGRAESRLGNLYAMPIVMDTARVALEMAELRSDDGQLVRKWMQEESAR